jgi:hypothetical protein
MGLDDFIQLLSNQEVKTTNQENLSNTESTQELKDTQEVSQSEPTNLSLEIPAPKESIEPKQEELVLQINGKTIITEIEQFVKHANSVLETIEVFLVPLEKIFVYAFETKDVIFVEAKNTITSFDNLVHEVRTAGAKGNFFFSLKQATEEFIKLLRKIFHL